MTKVDINGANHQVTIDVDHADLGYVIDKAQKLYEDTKPPERGLGPAYGFSMERQHKPSWDVAKLGAERPTNLPYRRGPRWPLLVGRARGVRPQRLAHGPP